MTRALRAALAAVVLVAACNEDLNAPGVCPDFCPPGTLTVGDSVVLDAVYGDSAFRGYVQAHEAASMLAMDLPGQLDSRPLFRTSVIPARISLGIDTTTGAVVGVDSMRLTLTVTRRDTSARDTRLAVYRLPLTIDSSTTFADVATDFAAPPIRTVNIDSLAALPGKKDTITGDSVVVDTATGRVTVLISFDSAQVGYTAADSGRLGLGIRASASGPGQASLAIAAEDAGPVLSWFARVDSLGLAVVKRGIGARAVFDSYVVDPPPVALDSSLAVGGIPTARSLIRVAVPRRFRDSTQVIRATLILVPVQPLVGAVSDSLRLVAQLVLADLGGKSPLAGPAFPGDASFFGAQWVHPGATDTVRIDVTDVVRRWQADTLLPTMLFLRPDQEGNTAGEVRFASSLFAALRPGLHVTYVPRYPFGLP